MTPVRTRDAVRAGATGPVVAIIRGRLAALGLLPMDAAAGGVFDEACDRAVRGFQQSRGLRVDGIVGPETYRALDEARWRLGDRLLSLRMSHPYTGDDVGQLQHRLQELGFDPGRADGIFGARTEQAVREFQHNVGLPPDGTCGPHTLKALDRLRRTVVGGRAQPIREAEELNRAGPTLAGKLIIVDPGHGGADQGNVADDGLTEASVVEDLAARLEGRLAASGALPFLTRGGDACPDPATRAAFANAAEADLLVSLHCDAAPSPGCNGVATYYFGWTGGDGRHVSTVGERLADLAQREIVARTDLLDCRTHPKTWALLRRTRMPAVQIELGYLSNPTDATRLGSAEFRDAVAEAILAALTRLYLPAHLDQPTGQLRVTELSTAAVS
jgi:N-acetylmuramoyl-L-alanine amidase